MFQIDPSAFIAEDADLLGDVTIGKNCSVWYHVTIRADRAPVVIGDGSNVQDNAVIHMGYGLPVRIGRNVTIGHSAIVHGAVIEDGALIGMGSILMNGCHIGRNAVVGAGALVTQGMEIPDKSLALGSPARVVRRLTDEELASFAANNKSYVREAAEYRSSPPESFRSPRQNPPA